LIAQIVKAQDVTHKELDSIENDLNEACHASTPPSLTTPFMALTSMQLIYMTDNGIHYSIAIHLKIGGPSSLSPFSTLLW
jgi:hypothetical protein